MSTAVEPLRLTFIITCGLTGISPINGTMTSFQMRTRAKELSSEFGPLPEIPITALDWLFLGLGVAIVAASFLEVVRWRFAAPLGLLSATLLWVYFGPGVWAYLADDGFFSPSGAYSTMLRLPEIGCQCAATISAAALTGIRTPGIGRRAVR